MIQAPRAWAVAGRGSNMPGLQHPRMSIIDGDSRQRKERGAMRIKTKIKAGASMVE
jgi:hypothetical protein